MKQTLNKGVSTIETRIHVAGIADVRDTFLKELFLGFRGLLTLRLRYTWGRPWEYN